MRTAVVLAMHGVPPQDFPREEMMELFSLHPKLEHTTGPDREALQRRHDELEEKMRQWPRTPENDPYYYASLEIAKKLEEISGDKVFIGFNEFCAPSIGDAIGEAAALRLDKIVVITPMMTRGGEHSERDIPRAIRSSRKRHPDLEIVYAWPFDADEVASFLADHMRRFASSQSRQR